MPKTHRPYPLEFRRRMVELVRAGRDPGPLAREFEPTAQSIRNWVAQADRDEGRRQDRLSTDERQEHTRLRREVKRLREEREILGFSGGLRYRVGDRLDPVQGFACVKANQAAHGVATMCRVLDASRSGDPRMARSRCL
jgi:transposase